MKRSVLKVILIASLLFLVVIVATFGFLNNFDFTNLNVRVMVDTYLGFAIPLISNFSLSGLTNLIVIGGTGLGLLLGLVAFIRSLFVNRLLPGFLAFLAVTVLFVLGVSLIIPSPDLAGQRYLLVILDGLSNDLVNTLFLAATIGFIYLSLLMIFLLGLTAQRKQPKKVSPVIPLTPSLNVTAPIPTATLPSAASTSNPDTLSELVKVVMQEELSMMRNNQPAYGMPAMAATNPYASS
ncbi:MAG: hypothetical protein ACO3BB_00540, partial [Bacilli bacterium]